MAEKAKRMKIGRGVHLTWQGLFLILTLLAWAGEARGAAKFPANPVKLVITHAAGTSNDIEARAAQPVLQKYLGVPVVIENMPGTGGRRSREYVFKQKPDGYALLSTGMPTCQIGEIFFDGRYKTLEFSHIFSLFSESIALVVKNDAPYKDMADFVKEHKKKTLSSAVAGVGGGAHFNGMNLARHLGLTVKWVPFDGGTQSLAALAGGHVDYVITDIGNVTAMVAAKTIRLLMIFGEQREPRYPDIPTSKELGYGITVIPSLRAVLGPPGLPAIVVKTLESAYKKTAQDAAFQALATKANVRVNPKDAKETFALSKNTWTAFKEQEEHLRSVMKSGK